jgi:6-phosphofructokinase 1
MQQFDKRIGILTAGGDCPGLNAVIRGVVKSANTHGYDVIGFLKGYEGLVDPVNCVPLTYENTANILNQGGTILGSTNRGRFAAIAGVDQRLAIDAALIAGVKATVQQLGLSGLICVGGDGSLAVAQQFHEHGIPVVGVPKTIDNDLSSTAFTFGFFSAVFCATDALDRLHTTAASHERVMVLEVMGRHVGWIGLYAGIAGGGDVILIPEIPWTFENVCQAIMKREEQGKRFTLVVVSEGARLPSGQLVCEKSEQRQQVRLGGIGSTVAKEIERRTGKETRVVVLGHLQRGGAPTTFDRVLATQFGAHAVRLVIEQKFGQMVTYWPPNMESVPIQEAIKLDLVCPDCSAVQAARALGISFGDDFSAVPFSAAAKK